MGIILLRLIICHYYFISMRKIDREKKKAKKNPKKRQKKP